MLEKIGVGDIVIWLIVLWGVYIIYRSIPHYWGKIKAGIEKNRISYWVKNGIIVVSVYVLTAFIIDFIIETSRYYFVAPAGILAVPATILFVFLYGKIAKKFNL